MSPALHLVCPQEICGVLDLQGIAELEEIKQILIDEEYAPQLAADQEGEKIDKVYEHFKQGEFND